MKIEPNNTKMFEVTLTVVADPKWAEVISKHTDLHDFFWEVFCKYKPLNKWRDRFQVADVSEVKDYGA